MTETTRTRSVMHWRRSIWRSSWGYELGAGVHRPDGAVRPRVRQIAAGDLAALEREILAAKVRSGLALTAPVVSCYEAGRDGFWLHRWLVAHGVSNVVVDSSSIEVSRRARRAKTDRLDAASCCSCCCGGRRASRGCGVWSTCRRPRRKRRGS